MEAAECRTLYHVINVCGFSYLYMNLLTWQWLWLNLIFNSQARAGQLQGMKEKIEQLVCYSGKRYSLSFLNWIMYFIKQRVSLWHLQELNIKTSSNSNNDALKSSENEIMMLQKSLEEAKVRFIFLKLSYLPTSPFKLYFCSIRLSVMRSPRNLPIHQRLLKHS